MWLCLPVLERILRSAPLFITEYSCELEKSSGFHFLHRWVIPKLLEPRWKEAQLHMQDWLHTELHPTQPTCMPNCVSWQTVLDTKWAFVAFFGLCGSRKLGSLFRFEVIPQFMNVRQEYRVYSWSDQWKVKLSLMTKSGFHSRKVGLLHFPLS